MVRCLPLFSVSHLFVPIESEICSPQLTARSFVLQAALEKMRNPDTAASRGHAIARQPKPEEKEPFTMKKFKNVKPRTMIPH